MNENSNSLEMLMSLGQDDLVNMFSQLSAEDIEKMVNIIKGENKDE